MCIRDRQYGDQARYEALNDFLERVFTETVKSQQLRVAGHPKIEPKTSESSSELEFTAVFEVYPEIKLGELTDVEIERSVLEVGATELDSTLAVPVSYTHLDVYKRQEVLGTLDLEFHQFSEIF